jgi:aminopeptidase N
VSFSIRQSCDLRGQNRLRKQKLNVAFYDDSLKAHIARDIILSEKDELTEVDIKFLGGTPIKAIIVNHGDHGYAKVRYDSKTLKCFEEELFKIDEYLERCVFWRQLWIHVLDEQISSLQYFYFVIKQLPKETVEQSITSTLMNLASLINNYIPIENVADCKDQMFETLYMMLKSGIPDGVKSPVVDSIFSFISKKENVALAIEWSDAGFIFSASEPSISLFDLKMSHKLSILKVVYASLHYSLEFKQKLSDKIINGDVSDLCKLANLTCIASLPDAKVKETVWQELIDPKSQLSLYERRAKMQGFFQQNQIEICSPYFEKFYDSLSSLHSAHTYKYIETFFNLLLPRM